MERTAPKRLHPPRQSCFRGSPGKTAERHSCRPGGFGRGYAFPRWEALQPGLASKDDCASAFQGLRFQAPAAKGIEGDALQRKQHGLRKRDFLLIIGAAAVVFVLLFLVGEWLESQQEQPETRGDYHWRYAADALEINGKMYRPKTNLSTILFMGIDQDSTEEQIGYRNGGQADFLRLIVIDHSEKTLSQLAIDRDTMTPVIMLGVLGNRSGIRTMQISLSHSFGDGKAQSCELTVEAVSNLLFSAHINGYVAMNLDGISVLNDSIGGVTVTLTDDFSALDPEMTVGKTITLQGKQAELFVRSRMSMSIGTNVARMARQQTYVTAMLELLNSKISSSSEYVGKLYDELLSYVVTSYSRAQMINEAWSARNYTRNPVLELSGEHLVSADGFMEFHVDETALQEIVLQLFYQEVK